jgi:hypothetical protein
MIDWVSCNLIQDIEENRRSLTIAFSIFDD